MANVSKSLLTFAESSPIQRMESSTLSLFPMYVVPAQAVLKMSRLDAFEQLMINGELVEFDDAKGHAMFVSHQWVGVGHPDPDMEQFQVLQDTLRSILDDAAEIPPSANIELYTGSRPTITGKEICSQALFIWYDYFSCPQDVAGSEARQAAISSIPAYVERCRYFAILCPHVRHSSQEAVLSKHTWATRGWCRLERVCKELSMISSAGDTIEIKTSAHRFLAPNYDWVKQPVGEGCFTFAEDRARISQVLRSMIRAKLSSFLKKKDFHSYRLLLNLQSVHFRNIPAIPVDDLIPGFESDEQDPAAFNLAHFKHQNGLVSLLDRVEGWTPLCYASLSGTPLLISALLEQKADPNDGISQAEPLIQFAVGTSCLCICAFLKHNSAMRLLLAAEADVHAKDGYGSTALHWAAVGNNSEGMLILHGAGGGFDWLDGLGYSCFGLACAAGSKDVIKELLPQVRAEELAVGLHAGLLFGGASAEIVALLIDAGAEVNQPAPQPMLSLSGPLGLLLAFLSLRHRWSQSLLSAYAFHVDQATPLTCGILSSSYDAAAVLLSAGARLDLKNSRGKTAQDLAQEAGAPSYILTALSGDCQLCDSIVKEHSSKIRFSV